MQPIYDNRTHGVRILAACVLFFAFSSSQAAALCDRDSSNTHDINACSKEDFQTAESRLNDAYKRVLAFLSKAPDEGLSYNPPEARKPLVEAQRAWITFREKDCSAQNNISGFTTLRPSAYFICMKLHAELRTKQLLEYLKPPER